MKKEQLTKRFLKQYGMTVEEYSEKHGIPVTTVKHRFSNGRNLIAKQGRVFAGHPMSYWMKATGLSYNTIYGRWLSRGDDMTVENLMEVCDGYEGVSNVNSGKVKSKKEADRIKVTTLDFEAPKKFSKKKLNAVKHHLEAWRRQIA